MTSIRIAGHPAPWPLLDLDIAAIRAAGHQPIPFRQFILKVHSRCNLSCSYCYVYEMADQAWRQMPKRMSQDVAQKAVERIAEHAEDHGLDSVDIIFHGGEPLLAGAEWLADLAEALHARVPAQVNLALQTNGTLLDRPMLETLKSLHVQVGVSLDGDAEATGRHRRYANGRNSFDAVADGLYLLESPEFRECYSGILCTIDVGNDPVATYEALLKFNPPAVDFLLPHANWSCPPPGTGYADWLISVFERWYSAPRQETQIRLFSELIQLVLGQPGAVEGLGLTAEHRRRGRHRWLYQATRLAQLRLSRRRGHWPARHVQQLRRRAGPSHHGRQADRRRRLVSAMPGLPGDGDLRWWPLPAPVPARSGLPQPLCLLRRPVASSSRMSGTVSSQTCAGSRPYTYGSISAVSRVQFVAARASGCSRVSVSSYLRSTSASRCSASAWFPAAASSTDRLASCYQRVRVIVAE